MHAASYEVVRLARRGAVSRRHDLDRPSAARTANRARPTALTVYLARWLGSLWRGVSTSRILQSATYRLDIGQRTLDARERKEVSTRGMTSKTSDSRVHYLAGLARDGLVTSDLWPREGKV